MSGKSLTEVQFQTKVIRFLKDQGVYVIKMWGGGRFTRAGVPDIIACANGHFIAVELKTEVGRVSKLQEFNLCEIRKSGGAAMVLRPAGFEDFKRFIGEVMICNSVTPEYPPSNNANIDSSSSTSIGSGRSRTRRQTTH